MTKLSEQALQEPSEQSINACLKEWEEDEKNVAREKVLRFLFKKQFPDNTKIEDILLKVTVLNDFYKINIYRHSDPYAVSKHILRHKIDKKLRSGDIDLVNKIAPVISRGETKTLYSFASKYCHHHKPEIYPIIYDRYVEKRLMSLKRKDKFWDFKKDDLKKYKKFLEIVHAFKRHYVPDKEFSLRQIDIYLWLTGKKLDEQRRSANRF